MGSMSNVLEDITRNVEELSGKHSAIFITEAHNGKDVLVAASEGSVSYAGSTTHWDENPLRVPAALSDSANVRDSYKSMADSLAIDHSLALDSDAVIELQGSPFTQEPLLVSFPILEKQCTDDLNWLVNPCNHTQCASRCVPHAVYLMLCT